MADTKGATKTSPKKAAGSANEEKNLQNDGGHNKPQIKATIHRVFDNGGSIKAVASLTIGGAYAVHGLKVIGGANGDFVAMPNVKLKNGEYKDTFHPITAEARQEMNDAVMAAYEQKLAETEEENMEEQEGLDESENVRNTGINM